MVVVEPAIILTLCCPHSAGKRDGSNPNTGRRDSTTSDSSYTPKVSAKGKLTTQGRRAKLVAQRVVSGAWQASAFGTLVN